MRPVPVDSMAMQQLVLKSGIMLCFVLEEKGNIMYSVQR